MILSERDQLYVEHMLECIGRIERYAAGDRARFLKSEIIQDAVVRNLQVLTESSQRLSEAVKNTRPDIDWRAISGFRNVLVHDYLGLDLDTIWLVITQDIPQLKTALKSMISLD